MSHSEDKNRRPHCSDLQEPFVHRTPLPPGGAAPLPAGGRRQQRARHARGHARQRRGSRRSQPRAAHRKALSRARSVTSQPPCPAGVTHPADVEPRAHSPDVARSSGRNPGPRGTRPRTGARQTHRGSDSGPRAPPTKTTPTCDMSREIVRRQKYRPLILRQCTTAPHAWHTRVIQRAVRGEHGSTLTPRAWASDAPPTGPGSVEDAATGPASEAPPSRQERGLPGLLTLSSTIITI